MRLTEDDLWERFTMVPRQVRVSELVIAQANWFDGTGHRIAGGDMAKVDFHALSRGLRVREWFFVLNSVLGHPTRCEETLEYVFDFGRFMVGPRMLYCLEPHSSRVLRIGGVEFDVIDRESARDIYTAVMK